MFGLNLSLNRLLTEKPPRRGVPRPAAKRAPARFAVRSLIQFLWLGMLLAAGAGPARSQTLQQLRDDPNLTPERFVEYFRDFEFKLGEELQSPDVFLSTQSGDCDDFASLAAEILGEKKYTTRLIAVFMDGQTHVVCYVDEVQGYLDYNCRRQDSAVRLSDGKLEDIAAKVAAYFRTAWRCAAEFSYQAGTRRFGRIAFR